MNVIYQGWPLAKARQHPTGCLHQGTNGNLPRNRAYLLTHLRTGHNRLLTDHKTSGYSDNDENVLRATAIAV